MNGLYLAALVVSLTGMVVLDVRFRLFFARSWWRATVVMVIGIAFFLVWDVAGITAGVFFRGGSDLLTGVLLAPELPLEELFFLALLCYVTMNAYGFFAARPLRGSSRSPREPRGLSSRRRRRVETPSPEAGSPQTPTDGRTS